MDKKKKHFAKHRAKEIRRKPPTKAQKRNQMLRKEVKVRQKEVRREQEKNLSLIIQRRKRYDEVAIDAIPLATKSPIIVDWKTIKEGKIGYFKSSELMEVQGVKAKHGNTRPKEAYERVLWGDLKVMFEPDVESEVWRNLQGARILEVFECILLVKIKLLIKKLKDSEDEHQVYGKIVGIKRLFEDVWKLLLLRLELLLLRITSYC
ncbi:hypothetical protein Tco_1127843 [Tanacetum coccineum]